MQQKSNYGFIKGLSVLSAVLLVGATGCADRNNNGQPESPATQGEVNRSAENAGDALENAANQAGQAAKQAANTISKDAKNWDDAAVITPKIKTAFMNNPSLKAMNINVDTTDKDVTLSGTVKNAAQKNLAGTIAKNNAPGYQIKNNLKVSGGASPNMNR